MSTTPFSSTWASRVEALTRWLVGMPSVTGTPGEAECAHAIHAWCAALPYFVEHPNQLRLLPTQEEDHQRYSVVALVKGRLAPAVGARTAILMGHLDTVPVRDYGPLMDQAFAPDALAEAMGGSPDYLYGRGALDMKSGDAAQLAVLERFAAGEGPQELSLLLVLTPDEEVGSQGILSVLAALPDLAQEWGIAPMAAINADYTAPHFPGDETHVIYAGTIGKLLPSLFAVGVETHAGEPFAGFDPNWLVAEVTRRIDYNPDLCEAALGEVAPPPVSLKLSDLKDAYSVQTALYSWAYFNWFTFRRSPAEVLVRFREVVADALSDLNREFAKRAAGHAALGGSGTLVRRWQPQVYTYAELSALVAERTGADFEVGLAQRLMAEPGIDLRTFSRRMTEELWQASGLEGPAAVVGYAHIYIPPVVLEGEAPLLRAARQAAATVAAEAGLDLGVRSFFPYISDMSFLGFPDGPEALAALRQNSPGWGGLYRVDHEAHARLNLPVINIGPWGEGAHTRLERVAKAYSFGVVPELIWRTIGSL